MAVALDYNFKYLEEKKEKRIIGFSSSAIGVMLYIPNIAVTLFLLPFVLFLIPVTNITLWRLHNKLKKRATALKNIYTSLSYEQAKEGYKVLSELVSFLEKNNNDLETKKPNLFTKGLINRYKSILDTHTEMKDLLASTLFHKVEQQPLSEKEKESLEALNDIWGDDQDEVYARHTHFHLKKAQ